LYKNSIVNTGKNHIKL
jgi:hypothetical protein